MPTRWVINPVVVIEKIRKPKVSTIADPGIPPVPLPEGGFGNKTYKHSSAISGEDWALSFVRGVDMSALDADPEIITVLDSDDENLNLSLGDRGWNVSRLEKLQALMTSKNILLTGLTINMPAWEWLTRIGQKHFPSFKTKGTWVK